MTHSQILTVRGAMRRFEGGHAALRGAELDVIPSQVTALLGPSGSGKSTLLRAIAGLETLDAGEIRLGDTVWCQPGLHVPPETRRVGLVFQDYALFPHLTALENVAFGLTGPERKSRALAQLEAAELVDKAGNYPHELSGGEQQRVALARALAPEPGLVLLDEPFSGLDRRLRADVRARTMDVLFRSGAAVLFVTHDPEEAMAVADQLALMDQGQIIQTGAPEDVWFNPVSITAARLLGDVNVIAGENRQGRIATALGALDAAPELADGPVEILIRPAGLSLIADPDGALQVKNVIAGGAQLLVTVTAQDGACWEAHIPAPHHLEPGQSVRAEINPAFARVLPV